MQVYCIFQDIEGVLNQGAGHLKKGNTPYYIINNKDSMHKQIFHIFHSQVVCFELRKLFLAKVRTGYHM